MKNVLSLLAGTAVLLVLALGSAPSPASADSSYYYNFEQTAKPFAASANDQSQGYSLSVNEGENGCRSIDEFHYAYLEFIHTDPAPGAWMQTSFRGNGADTVTLDFMAKGVTACEACQTIVYVGRDAPKSDSKFTTVKPTAIDIKPGTGRWQAYHYKTSMVNSGVIHVAIGFRGPVYSLVGRDDVTIGVLRSGGVDCLNVNIQPLIVSSKEVR